MVLKSTFVFFYNFKIKAKYITMDGSGFDDFNIEKQEYQSVFKVFDKGNTGEINITQVYDLINKFD